MASYKIDTWIVENEIEVMDMMGTRANKIKVSLYFATISKMEKVMLTTIQVTENTRRSHSEIIFFIIICSSNYVLTILNSKGLFYQIMAKRFFLTVNMLKFLCLGFSAGGEDYRNVNKSLKETIAGYRNHTLRRSLFHIPHSIFQKTNPFPVWRQAICTL
jgi:hypothetical protein